MEILEAKIGSHKIKFLLDSITFMGFIKQNFTITEYDFKEYDMQIRIKKGYGVPFVNYNIEITKQTEKVLFQRADYLIEANAEYSNATIYAYDEFALKHALTNLYSSYIVYHNWGLLIHSSCAIENGKAHIFAGHSGAGKSTAAALSHPRELLSDEATIVKITPDEVTVFDSPFRSELLCTAYQQPCPLAGIQLLHQSEKNRLEKLRKPDALLSLMDKVFYWHHDPAETQRIMGLLRTLVEKVPAYELHFRKDPTFWELIS